MLKEERIIEALKKFLEGREDDDISFILDDFNEFSKLLKLDEKKKLAQSFGLEIFRNEIKTRFPSNRVNVNLHARRGEV